MKNLKLNEQYASQVLTSYFNLKRYEFWNAFRKAGKGILRISLLLAAFIVLMSKEKNWL